MQNSLSFYDIFLIYHPEDIAFARHIADWLGSHNIICRLNEDIGKPDARPQSLRDEILRSHTIALVLSPYSVESQLCNELIEYAVTNGKRFISLIINPAIAAGFHPAIPENDYVFLRHGDDFDASANSLIQLLQVDAHLRLHTELLVSANSWNQEQRSSDLLLAPERVEEARQWLAEGANRSPKPSQLLVEFMHASRRQKPTAARAFPTHVALGIFAVLIVVVIIGIVQNAVANQSAATATAALLATSERQTSIARSAAASATADSDSAVRVIAQLAATSVRIREAVLATAAVQAQNATQQAAITATWQAATAMQAANARATERARLQRETADQAVIDGARRALAAGDIDLALALAWHSAQTHDNPLPALRVLRQALEDSPQMKIEDISLARIHPDGEQIALVPSSRKRVLVYNGESGRLDYTIDDHEGDISAIAYSSDGQFFISAAQDVVIRSSADGAPIHRLQAHRGPVRAMATYRKDSKLVTADDDGLILWDTDSGTSLAQYTPEAEAGMSINELLVTADDARLVAWADADGVENMTQHSALTLEVLTPDAEDRVYLGYDRDGNIAYSGGRSLPAYAGDPNTGDLVLWHAATGQQLTRLSQGFNWSLINAGNIASATDSLQFISFGWGKALLGVQNSLGEKRIALVELEDGTVQRTFADEFAAGLESAHFLGAELALSLTSDKRLVIWSIVDGRFLRQLGIAPQPLASIELDNRGSIVLGRAIDGSVFVWRIASDISDQLRVLDESADTVALNHDGDALLVSDNGTTRLIRMTDAEILYQSVGDSLARMNESGSHFAVAADREIQVIDASTGQIQATWSLHNHQLAGLRLAAKGEALLAETAAGDLLLLRAEQAAPLRLNKQLNSADYGQTKLVRFAEDSSAILSLHSEGALLWQGDNTVPSAAYRLGISPEYANPDRFKIALSKDGDQLFFFVMLDAGLASLTIVDLAEDSIQRQTYVDVAFGELVANGKYLLLSRLDGSLEVIDTSSGAIRNAVADLGIITGGIALLEERNWLYAAADNLLLIWDLASEDLVERFPHPSIISRFSLSRDGQQILTEDANGMHRLIRIETAEELLDSVSDRLAPRELTCAEREQYLALPFCK